MRKLLMRPVARWKAAVLIVVAGPLGGALINGVKGYLYCSQGGARLGITYSSGTVWCTRFAWWLFKDFLSAW